MFFSSLSRVTWDDFKSGFLIFLIALPLCLGISIASGFPPVAGLITAIVGAAFSSFLGSSRLTIKGPAAGLIVIVVGAVTELGGGDPITGYKRTLAVGVVAGLCQIVFARMKAGKLGALIPPSVVHGMLAAIGVIIFAKQAHVLLGVAPHMKNPIGLLSEIPESIANANAHVAILGLMTLATVFLYPYVPLRALKKVPGQLVALALVVPLALYWGIEDRFLVQIPSNILTSLAYPDFSALATMTAWKYVVMFALVGSIESLLTVSAVDSLDPEHKVSDLDADLFSTGVGNTIACAIGGLPMISEIVRSKANIDGGAKSSWSNFFHGVFLLASIVFLGDAIHKIALSALAGMLVFTGFRLASPKEFLKTYRIGADQLLLFVTTLGVTLATDLLLGVAVGVALKALLHLVRGVRPAEFFTARVTQRERGGSLTLSVTGAAVFSNFLSIGRLVHQGLAAGKKVEVDLSKARFVDHTTLERLHALGRTFGQERVVVTGLNTLKGVSEHELATRRFA